VPLARIFIAVHYRLPWQSNHRIKTSDRNLKETGQRGFASDKSAEKRTSSALNPGSKLFAFTNRKLVYCLGSRPNSAELVLPYPSYTTGPLSKLLNQYFKVYATAL